MYTHKINCQRNSLKENLKNFPAQKTVSSQVLVAHSYNPSYSGGRNQKDHSLKSDGANSLYDPISRKRPSQKRAGKVAQGVGPEFKHQYHTKKGSSFTKYTQLYKIKVKGL
jgi:hypothetical protein